MACGGGWCAVGVFCIEGAVDLVEVCSPRHANVGLLVYSPLAGGVLSGKYLSPDSDAAKKGRLNVFKAYMERYKNPLAEVGTLCYSTQLQYCSVVYSTVVYLFVR